MAIVIGPSGFLYTGGANYQTHSYSVNRQTPGLQIKPRIIRPNTVSQKLFDLLREKDPRLAMLMEQTPYLMGLLDASMSKSQRAEIASQYIRENSGLTDDLKNKIQSLVQDLSFNSLIAVPTRLSKDTVTALERISQILGHDVYDRLVEQNLLSPDVTQLIQNTFTPSSITRLQAAQIPVNTISNLLMEALPAEDAKQIVQNVNQLFQSPTELPIAPEVIGAPLDAPATAQVPGQPPLERIGAVPRPVPPPPGQPPLERIGEISRPQAPTPSTSAPSITHVDQPPSLRPPTMAPVSIAPPSLRPNPLTSSTVRDPSVRGPLLQRTLFSAMQHALEHGDPPTVGTSGLEEPVGGPPPNEEEHNFFRKDLFEKTKAIDPRDMMEFARDAQNLIHSARDALLRKKVDVAQMSNYYVLANLYAERIEKTFTEDEHLGKNRRTQLNRLIVELNDVAAQTSDWYDEEWQRTHQDEKSEHPKWDKAERLSDRDELTEVQALAAGNGLQWVNKIAYMLPIRRRVITAQKKKEEKKQQHLEDKIINAVKK